MSMDSPPLRKIKNTKHGISEGKKEGQGTSWETSAKIYADRILSRGLVISGTISAACDR